MAKKGNSTSKKRKTSSTQHVKMRKTTSTSVKKKSSVVSKTQSKNKTDSGKAKKNQTLVKKHVSKSNATSKKVNGNKIAKKNVKNNKGLPKKKLGNYWLEFVLGLIIIFAIITVMNNATFTAAIDQAFNDDRETYEKENVFNDCMSLTLEDEETINQYEKELISKLSIDSLAFAYRDLNTGYYVANNDNVTYYAASSIKLLDGLYIYTKARNGEIDLNETLTYNGGWVKYDGKIYRSGDAVTIRDLVRLAISISDNASHLLLVDYIGFNNLKEFGNSLGATTTLTGGDNYGNINAKDATLYLKELDKFLLLDDEYSKELYSYFYNADQKFYGASDDDFIHKYGNYGYYYNDLGIVYGNKEYSIVLLSHLGRNDYVNKYKEFYKIVNEFDMKYNSYKEEYCNNLVNEKAKD